MKSTTAERACKIRERDSIRIPRRLRCARSISKDTRDPRPTRIAGSGAARSKSRAYIRYRGGLDTMLIALNGGSGSVRC